MSYGLTNFAGSAGGHRAGLSRVALRRASSYFFHPAGGIYEINGQPVDWATIAPTTRNTVATFFDANGVLQTEPANVLRRSRDPVTGMMGALIEEQSTNQSRNPWLVGAAAGIPGTAPNEWSISNSSNGLTREIVGVVTVNNVRCLRLRLSGTATATAAFSIWAVGTVGQVAASASQTWTNSLFVRVQAGATTGLRLGVQEFDSGGGFLRGPELAIAPGATLARFAQPITTGASTASLRHGCFISYSTGQEINVTLDIGFPQLERLPQATSPILPPVDTIATSTRAADVPIVGGATFASFYNPAEGTVFVRGRMHEPLTPARVIFGIRDASDTFGSGIYVSRESGYALGPSIAPINVQSIVSSAAPEFTIAAAMRQNDMIMAVNGVLGGADTSCNMVANPVSLSLGNRVWSGNGNTINGHIFTAAYMRRRINNSALRTLRA